MERSTDETTHQMDDIRSEYASTTEYAAKDSENIGTISHGLPADVISDESSRFIVIPLAVLLSILIMSALVFLMARRNRHRLAHLYCTNKLTRTFGHYDEDSDSALDQQPNDVDDDLDDPTECLLRGKLQIDNQRYDTYQSIQVAHCAGVELRT